MPIAKTDIPHARELLTAALDMPDPNGVKATIKEALGLMTRTVLKKAVRVGNKVTDAHRAAIRQIINEEPELTDTEIAARVIGHASACGRVSEIRRAL